MNKPNSKKTLEISSFRVMRVRTLDSGSVSFDMKLNGINIYGCFVVESAKYGDFISFPQRKGRDGKYYSIVWANLDKEDTTAILQEVERILNE